MTALQIVIGYHTSFLTAMMVMTFFVVEGRANDVSGNRSLLQCTVIWSVWVVHESIAYSHWLPYQPS
jgi:hypothetical protein